MKVVSGGKMPPRRRQVQHPRNDKGINPATTNHLHSPLINYSATNHQPPTLTTGTQKISLRENVLFDKIVVSSVVIDDGVSRPDSKRQK